MDIEEYRNHLFTEKEEWNSVYNPKRCSIEALIKIEVKQRGEGPPKKIYIHSTTEPGPFFDPNSLHLHIWKDSKLIKNFECQQDPSVPFVEYTNCKTGLFCCVCHIKNPSTTFRWKEKYDKYSEEQEIFVNRNGYSKKDYIENAINFSTKDPIIEKFKEPNSRGLSNWIKIIHKVKYSLNFSKILYPISNIKSLCLWPWELTKFQLLNLSDPCYKNSVIFIKKSSTYFNTDYSYIE
jgi:hypothetical protein